LPQIEERLPADLFQSGRPGYVQFKTIPEVKLSGSNMEDGIPQEEQNAYNLLFVPPRPNNHLATSHGLNRWGKIMDGFVHLYSTTAGGTVKFRFRGRRVGILAGKNSSHGKLAFDVDGTAYGVLNCADTDGSYYNIPFIVATDLTDDEHVLTITKIDANTTSVQGFLVDDASGAQTFTKSAPDYHAALDDSNAAPKAVGTSDTSFSAVDTWAHNITVTNTTASPINVTLKNNAGAAVVGPFPVAANDIRQINGPIYFAGGLKASASAVGSILTLGGQ
jgi:hypothetical protein